MDEDLRGLVRRWEGGEAGLGGTLLVRAVRAGEGGLCARLIGALSSDECPEGLWWGVVRDLVGEREFLGRVMPRPLVGNFMVFPHPGSVDGPVGQIRLGVAEEHSQRLKVLAGLEPGVALSKRCYLVVSLLTPKGAWVEVNLTSNNVVRWDHQDSEGKARELVEFLARNHGGPFLSVYWVRVVGDRGSLKTPRRAVRRGPVRWTHPLPEGLTGKRSRRGSMSTDWVLTKLDYLPEGSNRLTQLGWGRFVPDPRGCKSPYYRAAGDRMRTVLRMPGWSEVNRGGDRVWESRIEFTTHVRLSETKSAVGYRGLVAPCCPNVLMLQVGGRTGIYRFEGKWYCIMAAVGYRQVGAYAVQRLALYELQPEWFDVEWLGRAVAEAEGVWAERVCSRLGVTEGEYRQPWWKAMIQGMVAEREAKGQG